MKDYYKILKVSTAATAEEIKKSFRLLAIKYHPDKTNNNQLAEAQFREVLEAYQVLSDTSKKKDYDDRLFKKSAPAPQKSKSQVTPRYVLQTLENLKIQIYAQDAARINRDYLYNKLLQLFSAHNVVMLKEFDDRKSNRLIAEATFKLCKPLSFIYIEKICAQLRLITSGDEESLRRIDAYVRFKKSHSYWERYKLAVAIVIAIILCFIIYDSTT